MVFASCFSLFSLNLILFEFITIRQFFVEKKRVQEHDDNAETER